MSKISVYFVGYKKIYLKDVLKEKYLEIQHKIFLKDSLAERLESLKW